MINSCTSCSTTNRSVALYCKQCGTRLSSSKPEGLDDLIGMENIKENLKNLILVMEKVKNCGLSYSNRLHTVLIGNTGTGKTKLVNILASLYHKYGVTKHDTPIIYDAVDYADFSKNFQDNYKKAKGNILCIENVQKLVPVGYSQSVEQLDRLFREMSKQENKLDPIIILSGQPQGFREFLSANDRVKSKFRFVFNLPDFNATELALLTETELSKHDFKVPDDAMEKLTKVFQLILKQSKMPDYEPEARNAGLALRMAENIKTNYYLRVSGSELGERLISPDDIKGDIEEEKTLDQVLAEIDGLIGMHTIKKAIRSLIDQIETQKTRAAKGLANEKSIAFHIVLTGNPGTGKTTVARKLGKVLKTIGILELGHVIEVSRSKMVGQYKGSTAPKVDDLCDQAMGGILFIDEAYTLKQNDEDDFGKEAIDALLQRMENDRGKFVVVIAGYPKEINYFLNANPGLQSRFGKRYRFHIDDYVPDELLAIFKKMASEENYSLDAKAEELIRKQFIFICSQKDKNFGNGREARELFEACRELHSQRCKSLQDTENVGNSELTQIRSQDVPSQESSIKDVGAILLELDKLTGLNVVKNEMRSLITLLDVKKAREEIGAMVTRPNLHFIFRGNPGTGKTTVARILADIFKNMGLLPKDGRLVEVKRDGLVGQYQGHTAKKTNSVIDTAMGGVLFIDEAYTLSGDDFGKEAIEALMTRMEDDKGKFVVIAAGYYREMEGFLNSNSGLASRFTKFIDFEDYSPSEMTAIYKSMLADNGMILDCKAEQRIENLFGHIYENRDESFANARVVRNLFEESLENHAARVGPLIKTGAVTPDILNTIIAEDITGQDM